MTHARQVFAIPFAGGNCRSLLPLQQLSPPQLVFHLLELPGRGARRKEPLCRSAMSLAEILVADIAAHIQGPYVLFGHSMGALVAFLAAQRLVERLREPELLVVSAMTAPDQPAPLPHIHALPSPQFKAALRDYGATPPGLLDHPALFSLFEPMLRADFELAETWEPIPVSPLPVPILALYGAQDILTIEQASAWAAFTDRGCRLARISGDHFFVQQHPDEVVDALVQALALS